MSFKVTAADQDFAAELALVRCVADCVQADVFVKVAGVSEGPGTNLEKGEKKISFSHSPIH